MMTKAQENRVRRLVRGFLPGDITAEEFLEELDRITGRSTFRKNRRAATDTLGTTRKVIQDRAAVG